MATIDFFEYIDQLRRFAPQIKSDAELDNFEPFQRQVLQRIINLVSQTTYNDLLTLWGTDQSETTTKGKAILYLRAAMANFMAVPYFVFEAGERNNTSSNLYRYQEDQQISGYIDNAWGELDQLFAHMDANIADFAGYAATDRYKIRETLYLKSPAQFSRYFDISNSGYFFNNAILFQEEIVNADIKSRIPDYPTVAEAAQWALGKAVAYQTVAEACRQLDYTELPKAIRNAIVKESNARKSYETEASIKQKLFEQFSLKAEEYWMQVDSALNEARNNGTYTLPEDTITEDDNFFML